MKATFANSYTIRLCNTFDDYDQCMEMQRQVWNIPDVEITPARIYIISQNAGGFLLGAFTPENRLIGFLHTFPAFNEANEPIYYSHMMAIAPELQNSGLGYELKLRQRERALERGIKQIIWTFDPLQSRNAYFNINKLGCVVRRYKINFYGSANTSVFDAGVESDRLMAEWWVRTPRAEAAAQGQPPNPAVNAPYIEIPIDINSVRASDIEAGRQWRARVRAQFQEMLARGLVVTGFRRGIMGGESDIPSRYYFSEWQPE